MRESSILTQTIDNKKVYVVNDISKDREVVNHVRETLQLKKVNNVMMQPFGQNENKMGGAMLLIMLDKFSMSEDGKKMNEKFEPSSSPVNSKVFQNVFLHCLKFNSLNRRVHAEILDENFVMSTMDKIMNQCTMYDFCKAIEIYFAELFNCERVNVVLVHRFKKFLYRVEPDAKTGVHSIQKFDFQAGIAGFVNISSHSLITESVTKDSKFNPVVDDPMSSPESPTFNMISCPVNASNDFQLMNKEGMTNYPRCII